VERFLLAMHVVAGILFVGPIAVVTSLFPRYAPVTAEPADGVTDGVRNIEVARVLHRITRVYGVLAVAVPVIGLILAVVQGRTTDIWVLAAMVLTVAAGALLALQISPMQQQALVSADTGDRLRRIVMLTGVFNLLWVVVVVLMVVRPGES
jgi:uncharacterized membrane protein